MIERLVKLPLKQSLFLFGPRNTGKSTLVKYRYGSDFSLRIDLLLPSEEAKFNRDPEELIAIVAASPKDHIVIDEIQKVPKLLEVVHYLIESTDKYFIMTGSSAKKLKAGGANLLAGRAFIYNLHAFSFIEVTDFFDLHNALNWGMLPKIFQLETAGDKNKFLQAYSHTYLKEEIWAEHFIRKLEPFRHFLEVAAQMNGKIINFHKIARDVGVDDKTVVNYYSILEDTLLGFFLPGFNNSFRKQLSSQPKFYFFDVGVSRALALNLSVLVSPGTSYYGEIFEQFIVLECIKLADINNLEFKFNYLQTKDGVEIDLVVTRPNKPLLCIEIKSSTSVSPDDLRSFINITSDFACEAVCFSNDKVAKSFGEVTVLPWQQGLRKFF